MSGMFSSIFNSAIARKAKEGRERQAKIKAEKNVIQKAITKQKIERIS